MSPIGSGMLDCGVGQVCHPVTTGHWPGSTEMHLSYNAAVEANLDDAVAHSVEESA
ncbi:MAG: hypothetical protein QOF33_1042 [Thermomicrobiales bacterium]|nr:hypothetical protein [Thermomicrobiales bacterium]